MKLRACTLVAFASMMALSLTAGIAAAQESKTFLLFPNPKFLPCLEASSDEPPVAIATVLEGNPNDVLTLVLKNVKPNLGFDMFTVQNSQFLANGTVDPSFKNFGLAWYQSDVQANSEGFAQAKIKTILVNEIFGFDAATSLAPTHTFNVGIWFNSPAEAAACGFTGTTPFNGEQNAGPMAMMSKPQANGLGQLCLNPNTSTTPATCNP
jgi:hypothetical protein